MKLVLCLLYYDNNSILKSFSLSGKGVKLHIESRVSNFGRIFESLEPISIVSSGSELSYKNTLLIRYVIHILNMEFLKQLIIEFTMFFLGFFGKSE